MLNLADPDRAFHLAQLPSAGVGLVRIEFVVSSWIGVHPMALLHPERVQDPGIRAQIRERCAGAASPADFFVERLASEWPRSRPSTRPVIVRFSDFKTGEYAGLLREQHSSGGGGHPMIGFRASRYPTIAAAKAPRSNAPDSPGAQGRRVGQREDRDFVLPRWRRAGRCSRRWPGTVRREGR
jgi:pyruvate,water dikinase